MEIIVATVGSPRGAGMREAIDEYARRAERYFRIRTIEVQAARGSDREAESVRAKEGKTLLRAIPAQLEQIALTRDGDAMTTRELADYIDGMATYGRPGAAFLIGGAFGLCDELIGGASRRLSLSRMTLPHDMARLALMEQLYRVGTILRGEPYHKGR